MTELTQGPPATRNLTWRNPEVRAFVYQVAVLAGVIGAAYYIFQNTLFNLKKRGISSGFSFLADESGFRIGEFMPIPQLEAGFLYFIAAIFAGLLAVYGLDKFLARKDKAIGEDYRLILLSIFLIVGVPAIVYFVSRHTMVTKTYSEESSYGLGLVTGIFNTVKVSAVGCVLATVIGFVVGISRLSSNWIVSKLAETYVEVIRNIPVLLQIIFWYFAVLQTMPGVKQSIRISDWLIINNRGVYLPEPNAQASADYFTVAVFISFVGVYFWNRHVNQVRDRTGAQLPVLWPSLAILVVLPGLVWLIGGAPIALTFPVLKGFNFEGGLNPSPEYAALLVALSTYHASYVAEIVRSGIMAVSKGQREAAGALGLRGTLVMRLVIIPQAMRVIVPPLTSQYLGVTKNSSLGVAIAFPELVSVGGTILNQSGQAIEIIAITMVVYLAFSLLIAMYMNWYNARVKLVER